MTTKEQAQTIAKSYAIATARGWDEEHHDVVSTVFGGELVWGVSTFDIKFSHNTPWIMERLPVPVHYYISMVDGICIGIGNDDGKIVKVVNCII